MKYSTCQCSLLHAISCMCTIAALQDPCHCMENAVHNLAEAAKTTRITRDVILKAHLT